MIYVYIFDHMDHHGYNVYGVKLTTMTNEELTKLKKEIMKKHNKDTQEKIDYLEGELERAHGEFIHSINDL